MAKTRKTQDTSDAQTVRVSVRLRQDVYMKLLKLAESDERTTAGEVTWLINAMYASIFGGVST